MAPRHAPDATTGHDAPERQGSDHHVVYVNTDIPPALWGGGAEALLRLLLNAAERRTMDTCDQQS